MLLLSIFPQKVVRRRAWEEENLSFFRLMFDAKGFSGRQRHGKVTLMG